MPGLEHLEGPPFEFPVDFQRVYQSHNGMRERNNREDNLKIAYQDQHTLAESNVKLRKWANGP